VPDEVGRAQLEGLCPGDEPALAGEHGRNQLVEHAPNVPAGYDSE
jgi:hypothetical protein